MLNYFIVLFRPQFKNILLKVAMFRMFLLDNDIEIKKLFYWIKIQGWVGEVDDEKMPDSIEETFTENMCLILTICSGSLLMFEVFIPKTMAYKNYRPSNINAFLVEDERTEPKEEQNYLLQHDMASDLLEDLLSRAKKSNYERKSEELPGFIVDYANMIRNDVILRDNFVQTRTRKRGNIKVKKYEMPIIPPCACEDTVKVPRSLGNNYYPTFVQDVKCIKELCKEPYKCQETIYNHMVLKRKDTLNETDVVVTEAPQPVSRWTLVVTPVISGCMCKKDYTVRF